MKKYLSILNWILAISLIVMNVSCDKFSKNSTPSNTEITNDEEGFFKGKILLFEKDLFGVSSEITYTFNGGDVQREVSEASGNIIYGMIYQKSNDSVVYYYSKDQQSWHVSFSKDDFNKWVTTLEKPNLNHNEIYNTFSAPEPFGTIFQPFEEVTTLLSTSECDLQNYGKGKCQTFLVPFNSTCVVGYSEKIKIRPEILSVIEYNQPKSISTLALSVNFIESTPKKGGNIAEKVLEKADKVFVKIKGKIEFNKIDNTLDLSMNIPKNSKKLSASELDDIINPPSESSGGGSHHDFDLF